MTAGAVRVLLVTVVSITVAAVAAFLITWGVSTHSTSGILHLYGRSTSAAAKALPLTTSGVVTPQHGYLPLDNKNHANATLHFGSGNLLVRHDKQGGRQSFNQTTCTFTQTEHGTFRVLSGTGVFSGASGHGTYTILFRGSFAMTAGRCHPSNSAQPLAALSVFRASGPVTVSHKGY